MSTLGDTMSTSGDIMSILRGVQYIGGISSVHRGDIISTSGDFISTSGGYHKYIGRCSVRWGFQYKLKGFVFLLPHMHHDMPPMYSWYPSDVLMMSPLMYSRYPPDVLMVSPNVLNIP